MAKYVGPCARCGVHVDRVLRPKRDPLCVDCAIDKQLDYCRALAKREHPDLEKCAEAGRATAEAIANRRGHIYEKWQANVIRAALGQWD